MSIAPSLATRAGAAFSSYRTGDLARLNELIDLLTPILWRAARANRLSTADAEDVVQIAWVRLVDHADEIDEPGAVLAWLLVTVRREAWRHSGRSAREPIVHDPTVEHPATGPGPETLVLLNERQRVLWRHVEALSPTCRHLLSVIAYADRPDYDAVARALGRPVGSIGPTRGRCLGKLRTALAMDPAWG